MFEKSKKSLSFKGCIMISTCKDYLRLLFITKGLHTWSLMIPRKLRNTWRPNRGRSLKDRSCSLTWPTKSQLMTGTREEEEEAGAEEVEVEVEEEAKVVRTRTVNISVITEC